MSIRSHLDSSRYMEHVAEGERSARMVRPQPDVEQRERGWIGVKGSNKG